MRLRTQKPHRQHVKHVHQHDAKARNVPKLYYVSQADKTICTLWKVSAAGGSIEALCGRQNFLKGRLRAYAVSLEIGFSFLVITVHVPYRAALSLSASPLRTLRMTIYMTTVSGLRSKDVYRVSKANLN